MKRIAEVRGGVVVRRHEWPDNASIAAKLAEDGGAIFRPYIDGGFPAFDPATQVCDTSETITQANVTKNYSVRSKTAPELDADKNAQVAGINGGALNKKILRNFENRLRLVENAEFGTTKPPLSMAELEALLKSLA